jgi:hypothetical protein
MFRVEAKVYGHQLAIYALCVCVALPYPSILEYLVWPQAAAGT